MIKEICTISMGKNNLDNDYIFYSDGKVVQICDKHATKLNIKNEHLAKELDPHIKKKLLSVCPDDKIELIIKIMAGFIS